MRISWTLTLVSMLGQGLAGPAPAFDRRQAPSSASGSGGGRGRWGSGCGIGEGTVRWRGGFKGYTQAQGNGQGEWQGQGEWKTQGQEGQGSLTGGGGELRTGGGGGGTLTRGGGGGGGGEGFTGGGGDGLQTIITEEIQTLTTNQGGEYVPAPTPAPTTSGNVDGSRGGGGGGTITTATGGGDSTGGGGAGVTGGGSENQQAWVEAHNSARAQHGAAKLSWDNAAYGQALANAQAGAGSCALKHTSGGKYGENLYGSSGGGGNANPTDVVGAWMNEEYTGPGSAGHFTAVVWKATTGVGCAAVACSGGGTYVACCYNPAGNVGGQYDQDVTP